MPSGVGQRCTNVPRGHSAAGPWVFNRGFPLLHQICRKDLHAEFLKFPKGASRGHAPFAGERSRHVSLTVKVENIRCGLHRDIRSILVVG